MLIELLGVIAIIALLAAILFPVFAQAREMDFPPMMATIRMPPPCSSSPPLKDL
jgi:hypothetical protein